MKKNRSSGDSWLLSYAALMTMLVAALWLQLRLQLKRLEPDKAEIKTVEKTVIATPTASLEKERGPRELSEALKEEFIKTWGPAALERVRVFAEERGVVVRIFGKKGEGLYSIADPLLLRPEVKAVFLEVGRTALKFDHDVRVESHRASEESIPSSFRNGWVFSSARAGEAVSLWVKELHFPSSRISSAGFSDSRALGDPHIPDQRLEILLIL